MVRLEMLAACVLLGAHAWACASSDPAAAPPEAQARPSVIAFTGADEPPTPQAVASYLADVLMPAQGARRTPTGYALLDVSGGVARTIDLTLTQHQCWKIKDGYQCQSTVRTTTKATGGRARAALLQIDNDYQWREGRLFSARLEAARTRP
jgi:hypothetical protein